MQVKCLLSLAGLSLTTTLCGQALEIHGVVKDDQGKGLPKVRIEQVGVNNITESDAHGVYHISLAPSPHGSPRLRFSHEGMQTQEFKVHQDELNVLLYRRGKGTMVESVNTASRGATSIYGNAKPL